MIYSVKLWNKFCKIKIQVGVMQIALFEYLNLQ